MIPDRPSSCRICVGDAVHCAEAAIQASEERVPVLAVAREVDAPLALEASCPSELPLSGDLCLSLSLTRAQGAEVA
jgi:hypothetical protein